MKLKRLARAIYTLAKKFIIDKREPNFIIGRQNEPYLLRWWIIPKNKFFNIYLHKFLRSDLDEALHNHPWHSLSIILKGKYREYIQYNNKIVSNGVFDLGSIIYRKPETAHRVELVENNVTLSTHYVYTLFITGPKIREWGFFCPKGWIPYQDFVDEHDKGNTGKGCPE